MTNRERALQIANDVLDYLNEPWIIEPIDISERRLRLEAAKIMALADIGEWLEDCAEQLDSIDKSLGGIA